MPEEPYDMMFISDAEAYGYKRCSSCFGETDEMEIEPLPDYDYFIRHYEPEYSEFVESEFVD